MPKSSVGDAGEKDDADCEHEDDADLSSWPKPKTAQLIELFQQKQFLYDYTTKNYHNRVKKDAAMNEIADEMNVTG